MECHRPCLLLIWALLHLLESIRLSVDRRSFLTACVVSARTYCYKLGLLDSRRRAWMKWRCYASSLRFFWHSLLSGQAIQVSYAPRVMVKPKRFSLVGATHTRSNCRTIGLFNELLVQVNTRKFRIRCLYKRFSANQALQDLVQSAVKRVLRKSRNTQKDILQASVSSNDSLSSTFESFLMLEHTSSSFVALITFNCFNNHAYCRNYLSFVSKDIRCIDSRTVDSSLMSFVRV